MSVTNRLKDVREQHGLVQKDLADATGFSIRTISRIERLEQPPSGEFMLRIAGYFHIMVEDLFEIKE